MCDIFITFIDGKKYLKGECLMPNTKSSKISLSKYSVSKWPKIFAPSLIKTLYIKEVKMRSLFVYRQHR